MSVAKNVVENKIVPRAIGLLKKGKSTIFNTCIFAPIIATTVYTYMPTSPNNFKKIKIVQRQNKRKTNQVRKIGVWFNATINPEKSKTKSFENPIKISKTETVNYF